MSKTLVSKIKTNLRKVTEGWTLLLEDWGIQTEKLKYEWSEGNYSRAIFHTLSGYKTSLLRLPYRTWGYLWELKWLVVLWVWVYVEAPVWLRDAFEWSPVETMCAL